MDRPWHIAELFHWAVTQAEAAATVAPIRLNQESYPDGESPGKLLTPGINRRGWPFTPAFESYLDGKTAKAPISQALDAIHSDPSMRLEFEIAWAIVEGGHDDLDTLYGVLGRPNGFDAAARRGLSLLRDKTTLIVQKRLAETSQRRETAGAAERARAEDNPKIDTKNRKRKVPA